MVNGFICHMLSDFEKGVWMREKCVIAKLSIHDHAFPFLFTTYMIM